MANPPQDVFEINVSLNYITPPIWRRLVVSPETDLGDLHLIVQITMGWTDSHLHQFIAGNDFYGVPDPYFESEVSDESGIQIGSLLKKDGEWVVQPARKTLRVRLQTEMVRGLDKFVRHFAGFEDCFVLIGGTACELWARARASD